MTTTTQDGLAMPLPTRRKVSRTTVNVRMRADIEAQLQQFREDHSVSLQDTVDLAVLEFLQARGYDPTAG